MAARARWETAREFLPGTFSPCPCSHIRHSRKVRHPSLCGEKLDAYTLAIMQSPKESPWQSAALSPWRRCQEGILWLLLTLPSQPRESALKFCSPLSVVRNLTQAFCTHAEPELTSAKCSTAPLEKVPGRNSLAVSHPARAAM